MGIRVPRRPRPGAVRRVLLVAVLLLTGGCAVGRHGTGYATLRHPFRGARLFLSADTQAADWQRRHGAGWLDPITRTPQSRWLTGPQDVDDLAPVLRAADTRHELLVLVVYDIPDLDCAGAGHGAADAGAYRNLIERLIARLTPAHVVIVLEPDAVAADCFDAARAAMLSDAVRRLARAGHAVYLDAGNSHWRPPEEMAGRLRSAGIAAAEGFSVNVSNRQSTADSQRYAAALSRLLGGREAVIDTSRNGLPAPPGDAWCNAEPQALGQPPTTSPRLDRVAALLWIKAPGESDGSCAGGRAPERFLPRQARTLITGSPWVSAPDRRAAEAARPPGS
jgi:endoglucanase